MNKNINLRFRIKVRNDLEQLTKDTEKREKNPTNDDIINNTSSSMRYRRRTETKNILEYIHGGD